MTGGLAPPLCGMSRFHGIAHILARRERDMAQQIAGLAPDRCGIAAVGAALLAADIKLGCPVDRVRWRAAAGKGRDLFQRFLRGFRTGIGRQPFPAAFAAKAAFAHTAKARRRIHHIGAIHPDDARYQLGRDIQREVDILGPDRRRQPVAGVIGQLDRLGRGAEGGGYQHGAKDLVLHQRIGRVHAGDQCGRIIASGRGDIACGKHLATGVGGNHFGHALHLNGVHQRAYIHGFVQRVTDPQLRHPRPQLGIEPIRNGLMHQQARACTADLPLIEPDRIHQPLDG